MSSNSVAPLAPGFSGNGLCVVRFLSASDAAGGHSRGCTELVLATASAGPVYCLPPPPPPAAFLIFETETKVIINWSKSFIDHRCEAKPGHLAAFFPPQIQVTV